MQDRGSTADGLSQHLADAVDEGIELLHGERKDHIGPERFENGLAGNAAVGMQSELREEALMFSPRP